MFITTEDKRVIGSWSVQYGWSETVAKRNFTVYRALEWLAACIEDELPLTEGWFWCQLDRIGRSTGMSTPTIRSAVGQLHEVGFLERERRWVPRLESQCNWFRLKIPPSCAGRVAKYKHRTLEESLRKPTPGTEKSSCRAVKKFSSPSYMSKRERIKKIKEAAIQEIQEKCLRNGLDPAYWMSQTNEIVETIKRADVKRARIEREVRSAGPCDPLDVKLKAKTGRAA